jgi:hypothetical protein
MENNSFFQDINLTDYYSCVDSATFMSQFELSQELQSESKGSFPHEIEATDQNGNENVDWLFPFNNNSVNNQNEDGFFNFYNNHDHNQNNNNNLDNFVYENILESDIHLSLDNEMVIFKNELKECINDCGFETNFDFNYTTDGLGFTNLEIENRFDLEQRFNLDILNEAWYQTLNAENLIDFFE